MSEGFDDNKTEAPTPRRREKAAEEGQVVFSPDFNSALVLMLVTIASLWLVPMLATSLTSMLQQQFSHLDGAEWGISATVLSARWLFTSAWTLGGVAALGVIVLSVLLSQAQSGFTLTSRPLEFNWERLSPVKGFEKLWSIDSLVRGLQALVKVTTLLIVAGVIMWLWRGRLAWETHGTLEHSISVGWSLTSQTMLALAGAALVWGAADYGFRFFRHEQKLKMSRQEIRDEMKDEDGDPLVKQRVRRLQKEAAERKTLRDVPQATVVLTNPTHYAVALRYEAGKMKAPIVIAKGSNAFARQIARVARENGVPVLERKPLARALYALAKVGQEIPIELFRAVAEVLAFVYQRRRSA